MTKSKSERRYVIVRTINAGVFAGNLVSQSGKDVELANARRLWYWSGAATLSQLAMCGTSRPSDCKFAIPVKRIILTEAIEIIDVGPVAKQSIEGVAEWRV